MSFIKNLFSFPSNNVCNLSFNPHFQIIQESVLLLLCEVLLRQLVHSCWFHCYIIFLSLLPAYSICGWFHWHYTTKTFVNKHGTKQVGFESPPLYNSDLKFSGQWCAMKYSQLVTCVKMKLLSGVLKTASISIIRGYCDEWYSYQLHLYFCSSLSCLNIYCSGSREQSLAGRLHTHFFVFSPLLEVLHFHILKRSIYWMFLLDHAH